MLDLLNRGSRLRAEVRRLRNENRRLESLVSELQPSANHGVVFDPFHPSIDRAMVDAGHQYFLVTSWGHSASIWYAGSLNLHEAFFCNVGAHHPIQSFKAYWLNVDHKPFVERATQRSFRFGANIPNPMSDGSPVPKFELPRLDIPPRDMARLPWFIFDEMDDMVDMIDGPKPRFVGSVHGLWLPPLAEALHSDPAALGHRRFPLLNLIRHPVGRTQSAIAAVQYYLMLDLKADIDRFIDEHVDEVRALERTYRIDFSDPRARATLHVFRQGQQNLTWSRELIDYPRVKHIKMELLQSARSYFAAAFNDLTGGRLKADNAYLDEVFKPENLGSGRQQRHIKTPTRPAGPRDQFDLWSDFERDEFRRVADQLNLRSIYAAHDYDLSFV